jgi:poly(A) polymerase
MLAGVETQRGDIAMPTVTGLRLPEPGICSALADAFQSANRQLYLVGGSVRDLLLGRTSADIDFTTDARPDEIKRLVRRAGAVSTFSQGERFGTIGANFHADDGRQIKIEITTFRAEAYEAYSRKPAVDFGQSLEADLARRDFTINAMALDLTSSDSRRSVPGESDMRLVDPYDGVEDLGRHLLRAVGNPGERFAEDPLRLLRAVRFATQLDFRIDPETSAALQAHAHELGWVPKERLQPELRQILLSERAADGLRLLCDSGLMAEMIPELLAMRGMHDDLYRHKDIFEHTLRVVENVPPEAILRLAALLHDIAKPKTRGIEHGQVHFHRHEIVGRRMARQILERLKYPREVVDEVALLVELHLRPNSYEPDWTDGAVRRLMLESGPSLDRLLELSRADVTSRRIDRRQAADRRVNELRARCEELLAQADLARLTSPLDGNELMAMFDRPPGPWIKPLKDHLTNLVIEGELAVDDKERAAEIARELMAYV